LWAVDSSPLVTPELCQVTDWIITLTHSLTVVTHYQLQLSTSYSIQRIRLQHGTSCDSAAECTLSSPHPPLTLCSDDDGVCLSAAAATDAAAVRPLARAQVCHHAANGTCNSQRHHIVVMGCGRRPHQLQQLRDRLHQHRRYDCTSAAITTIVQ